MFPGPITNLLSVLCVFVKILSPASAKKETKRLKVSNFAFYSSFLNDIMAKNLGNIRITLVTVFKERQKLFSDNEIHSIRPAAKKVGFGCCCCCFVVFSLFVGSMK